MIKLILPLPPSVNTYYENASQTTWRGKSYMARKLSDAAHVYRKEVWLAVKQQRLPMQRAQLDINVLGQPRDLQSWDLDNRWKALLDSFQHCGLIVNDKQFDKQCITRGPIYPGGRVIVLITKFDPDAALAPWIEHLSDAQLRLTV